jgi:hypothetical protein
VRVEGPAAPQVFDFAKERQPARRVGIGERDSLSARRNLSD